MKITLIVSIAFLLGSLALQAQNIPSSNVSNTPDKTWVLKDYPGATNIKWHQEKNGQIEFEFVNEQKETKVWFDGTGKVLRTKTEAEEKESHKASGRGKKEEEDEDDDDDSRS
ncbi:MAG: hypothetical protein IT261_07895 [Saprospiraceae bacterium]|nr:hypothetical protein [Saprospiraceae bacterium]